MKHLNCPVCITLEVRSWHMPPLGRSIQAVLSVTFHWQTAASLLFLVSLQSRHALWLYWAIRSMIFCGKPWAALKRHHFKTANQCMNCKMSSGRLKTSRSSSADVPALTPPSAVVCPHFIVPPWLATPASVTFTALQPCYNKPQKVLKTAAEPQAA